MRVASLAVSFSLVLLTIAGCGGGQKAATHIETRPLGETEALEIIREVLAERGFSNLVQADVLLANNAQFNCDLRVNGHPIGVEYVTDQDHQSIGAIPPPAGGSRLHVLRGRVPSADPMVPGEMIYVFFINSQNFMYHFNPTSEIRANVTFLDVDARLRRDLNDFLSWYERDVVQR